MEQFIDDSENDFNKYKNEFSERIENLRTAMIDYKIADTDETRDNFINARSFVEEINTQMRALVSSIEQEQDKVIIEIRDIQNRNNESKQLYDETEKNTSKKLDDNLASFPLKSQTELKKRIMYFYLLIQIIGIIVAIVVMYVQIQTKPKQKIKPRKIKDNAQKQLANTYNIGRDYTNKFGNQFLDVANRGTAYSIRQGRRATNQLMRFMLGNQAQR